VLLNMTKRSTCKGKGARIYSFYTEHVAAPHVHHVIHTTCATGVMLLCSSSPATLLLASHQQCGLVPAAAARQWYTLGLQICRPGLVRSRCSRSTMDVLDWTPAVSHTCRPRRCHSTAPSTTHRLVWAGSCARQRQQCTTHQQWAHCHGHDLCGSGSVSTGGASAVTW
jgi:hypothetical protein